MKSLASLVSILLIGTTVLFGQFQSKAKRVSALSVAPVASAFAARSVKYSDRTCSNFADQISALAIPCNGISVTTVSFNAAGRIIESGTNNTVGVRYRYPNVGVAPDGTFVDALVTVLSYSNTQDADQTTFRDADAPSFIAGFEENLQPSLEQESDVFLNNGPWNANMRYRIQFVVGGTSTPRVISIAATSIDNDGSNSCGGLRENVSYSPGFAQILLSPATNQSVSGNVVTSPLTNQAGIGIGANFASSALYQNISEFEWTHGFSTSGNCSAGGASTDRWGSLNFTCQINFGQNFSGVAVSGTVFNDVNGLTDSTVNGVGTGVPGGTQVYISLIDSNGNVVSIVPVNANGTYTFPIVFPGTYTLQLSSTQGFESNPAPAQTLPSNFVNTGENLGAGAGSDGLVNGRLAVTVGAAAVTNANFGIQQRPLAADNTAPTQVNPGGSINLTVPPATFAATDPDGGTITAIRITSFPSAVASITINGIQYTSATFPPGGVVIPANASGNPLQTVEFDPFEGPRTIIIPFVAIDNLGFESLNPGSATIPVSAGTTAGEASISGRVLDENGRGIARARVTLVGPDGISRTGLTNPFGFYFLNGLDVNAAYIVSVDHKRYRYEQRLVTINENLTGLDFIPLP
ncbi:MAG TPA: carboxypeptidase regulatory-like domain-containing protein [Pyrinomonadaceae bacterium]|nr:carboxypeptidase regulatory-like domain-containing protein [Pyrinomonadaceae bacterium]